MGKHVIHSTLSIIISEETHIQSDAKSSLHSFQKASKLFQLSMKI